MGDLTVSANFGLKFCRQFWQLSGSNNETPTIYFTKGKQEKKQHFLIGVALGCHELDLDSHAQTEFFACCSGL